MNEIGVKILELMSKNDIQTIKELNEKSGVSRTTLSNLLNGKAESVSFFTIIRLCKVLDCEVMDLVKVKGEKVY